jgi:predicted permease
MKFSESWKLAGVISQEARFQAYLEMNPSNLARVKERPERIARSIKSSSRISGIMTTFILIMIAILSLAASGFDASIGQPEARLAVGFTVYLALSFVVVFFLNLTSTTGLISSGAMELPSTLPLSRADIEQLSFMTFARVFFAPVMLSLTIFPIGCLLVYGPLVAGIAFVACASTVSIAIGALISMSKWFYRKSHSSDESKSSAFVRMAATIGIMLGMVSVYSLSSYLPDFMRFIIQLSSLWGETAFTSLALVFPFSYGFLAASFVFSMPLNTLITSIAGTFFYTLVAIVAYQRSGKSLRQVTMGDVPTSQIISQKEIFVEVASPLKAMVRKDLKLATRNMGSAFVFAIPIFLVIMIYPMVQFWKDDAGLLRSMTALTAVNYANLFGGISLVSILMFDTQGASVHEGLPISSKLVLRTKTSIVLVPYTLCMVAIGIMILINSPITPLLLLVPVIQLPCGYVIGMAVGAVIFRIRGGGRAVAVNVTSDQAMGLISAATGAIVGIAPLISYGLAMLATGSQIISLAGQSIVVLMLVFLAWKYIPRLLKD